MNKSIIFLTATLLISIFINWRVSTKKGSKEGFSENVKVALRNVGHQLLISEKDSTSLVMPIIEIDKSKFELSFQKPLSFEPNLLVSLIKKNFERINLTKNYHVKVVSCSNKEVSYSYKISNTTKKSIIPCKNRVLPKNCYTIVIKFIDTKREGTSKSEIIYVIPIVIILVLLLIKFVRKPSPLKENKQTKNAENDNVIVLGAFSFYPEQNKLIKESIEIKLSKKENELLTIFTNNPNQIIKREVLMKKVWEDKGVIVGRSLDTYISKLRKILKEDNTIKLVNVHGVGYKLQIK